MALNAADVNGRVRYIEPTNVDVTTYDGYTQRAIIPSNELVLNNLEDYCIAVDLEVCIPDRKSCGLSNETGEAIHIHYSATNGNISFMHGTSGVLTTNFTDVNVLEPEGGTAEMFGIESINIAYDSWLYPQVTIRFVDVRGAAVMQPEESVYQNKTGKGSLYRALFTFPYPMFRLKVKGFYGKGATFYLCVEDTSIELDASSGNFIITAKFIGMMYRIYADMPMSYVCIAPYMTNGINYWNEQVQGGIFQFKNRNGTSSDMIKFPELRKKIADAAFSEQKLSAAAQGEKITSDIDTQISKLDTLRMSCPINNWKIFDGDGYLFTVGEFDEGNASKTVSNYMADVKNYDETYGTSYESSLSEVAKFSEKKNIVVVKYKKEKSSGNLTLDSNSKKEYNTYISGRKDLQDEINNYLLGKKGENSVSVVVFPGNLNTAKRIVEKDMVEAKDNLLAQRQKSVEEYKALTDALLEEALGFTPSIENIYNLAFAHLDTFMHAFYDHMTVIKGKIERKDTDRAISSFAAETDVPMEEVYLPPYPSFFVQKNASIGTTAQKTEVWPEEIPGGAGSKLDEVNFVKDLLSASKLYQEAKIEADKYIEALSERQRRGEGGSDATHGAPSTSVSMFIPMTVYDFVNKDTMVNPYSYLRNNNYSADAFERNVFATFALRSLYYLSTNTDNKDAESFGTFEAVNMAKAIGEDISEEKFWDFIEDLKNKNGSNAINILEKDIEELDGIGKLLSESNGNITCGLGNYFPIGRPNLLDIKAANPSDKSVNPSYVKEKEDVIPKNSTFHYFDSRDYISQIYQNIDAMIDGTSEEDDKKYDIKARKDVVKSFRNNIDDAFDGNDASTINGVIKRMDNDKNAPALKKIGAENYNDIINNYYVKFPAIINESKSSCLFDSDFYKIQNNDKARAYLFLSAMPMKSSGKDKNQACGIAKESKNGIEAKAVLLREGSFYWRQDEMKYTNDPINVGNEYKKAASNETYMGVPDGWLEGIIKSIGEWFTGKNDTLNPLKKKSDNKYLEWTEPKGTTPSRREVLKNLFLEFSTEFARVRSFLENPKNYDEGNFSKGLSKEAVSSDSGARLFLNNLFLKPGIVLDYYSSRDVKDDKFTAKRGEMETAFNAFINSLKRIYQKTMNAGRDAALYEAAIRKAEDPFNNNDLRLSTYNTLKDLYDKWLSSPFNGTRTWKFKDPASDFSKFKYIDSFYREIGRQLLVNITKVGEWISMCLPTQNVETEEGSMKYTGKSFYEFLAETAQHTGGMLFAFPQMIGALNDNYMADMFKAMPFNSDWDTDSSSFVFIYTYRPSEHIGLDKYNDDGFQLNTEQAIELLGGQGLQIPAFGVSYGKQNQSFFKNITLNTESNNVTEASIAATLSIASKASEGARESNLFGQDLYRVKTSYSYMCEFDMMGCVQIMPLMYFQLNNVPFWRGAYMVIKVTHQLTAGDMTTHVVGVRINRNSLPMTEGMIIPANEAGAIGSDGASTGGDVYGTPEGATSWEGDKNKAGNPNAKLKDSIDFDEGNITSDKPIICLTPAHGPKTQKSAEWFWSSTLIDDYIIPKLSRLTFYDGTSYAKNIQRCNKNGNHTGNGYSMEQTRSIVNKYGSDKVISVVPHWNGCAGNYFAPYYGQITSSGERLARNDSKAFATIFKEESMKVSEKASNGTFKKVPNGMLSGKPKDPLILDNSPSSSHKANDGAVQQDCACVLTENWFADYPKKNSHVGSKDELSTRTSWKETDENGRYKVGEGWLLDEEGLNAISDMHVEAIRRFINNLHERVRTMGTSQSGGGGAVGGASEDVYIRCAQEIGCEVAALKAVVKVESGGRGAFIAPGKPPILFEGHVFWRNLSNPSAHVRGNEDILYSSWTKKYYKGGLAEYDRLERAKAIDETAALKAASWGLLQILGENYAACGCSSVQEMVNKMCQSADNQVILASKFIISNSKRKNALINKDWATFAYYYNGAGYKENDYDTKLRNAYNQIAGKS